MQNAIDRNTKQQNRTIKTWASPLARTRERPKGIAGKEHKQGTPSKRWEKKSRKSRKKSRLSIKVIQGTAAMPSATRTADSIPNPIAVAHCLAPRTSRVNTDDKNTNVNGDIIGINPEKGENVEQPE